MASIDEEIARLKFLSSKGRGHEKCHVVLIEEEARVRAANDGPKPKTRFVFELDDPEMYSRFNELKDRWMRLLNKSVAVSLMAQRWDLEEHEIAEMGEGL